MIKKISLASGLGRSGGREGSGKIVKYSACSTKHDDDDLDEVAVISNAAPESVKYGSGALNAANGPRVVPGIITSGGVERSRFVTMSSAGVSIVQREYRALSTTGVPKPTAAQTPSASASISTNIESAKPADDQQLRCSSRQSLIETVTSKFHQVGGGESLLGNGSGTDAKIKVKESMTGIINRAHVSSDLEISKKAREQRRKDIKREFERWETSTSSSDKAGCNWSFVFDPSGRLCYYWSLVVSIAFLYNFWVIIYRFAFEEINETTMGTWFILDYFADFIYFLDITVHFRTGYLDEGVLQTDPFKLRTHYMNSTMFYIDSLCLLPLDFLYLSMGFNSIFRCFRLVKIYRFWAFLDRSERHTNYPNVFRTVSLVHYILAIFHWNACLYHIILSNDGFGSRDWFMVVPINKGTCEGDDCVYSFDYLHAIYFSTLALTTIGDLPRPRTRGEIGFLIIEFIFALFLFATVLGYVANIVTNVSAARKEFQAKLDGVKTFMRMRRVPDHLQNKVIRWFDYLWMTQKSSDEERAVICLPDKLKAEIAIHVHLDTLKRVEIFQNTEAGFLCELVLRLRPVLFSPGDYICRKGEVGKEMYIVNRGRLQVVTDNGKTVLATLRAGSYFGEISILNMGTAGNRRTASVRSVGYSDLFCLNKQDLWDVLKDYPAARVRLEAIAVKRLEKYKKEPLKKIALGRSRSTPGLVESKGKVPIGDMQMQISRKDHTTSASTATLLTDEDELEKTNAKMIQDMTVNETESMESESDMPSVMKSVSLQPPSPSPFISGGSLLSLSPIPTSSQPIMFAHQILTTSNAQQMMSYDSRSPQANMLPTGQTIAFYSHSPDMSPSIPSYCAISPAASSAHLAVPVPHSHTHPHQQSHSHSISMHAPSPSLSTDTLHSQQLGSAPMITDPTLQQEAALTAEIKRLRERLLTLETENASMTVKLSQQQWEVENRLAEIEMQISVNNAAGSGTSGAATGSMSSGESGDDNERNKESVI